MAQYKTDGREEVKRLARQNSFSLSQRRTMETLQCQTRFTSGQLKNDTTQDLPPLVGRGSSFYQNKSNSKAHHPSLLYNQPPTQGAFRKGQRGNQKRLAFDAPLCRPAAGCYLRAGQGQVPVTLSMPCHCGGTGTTEWGQFSSHRWRVEDQCIQAQRSQEGPRLLRRMGRTSIFASTRPGRLFVGAFLYQGVISPGFLSFTFKLLEPLLLSVLSVSSFSVSYLG